MLEMLYQRDVIASTKTSSMDKEVISVFQGQWITL